MSKFMVHDENSNIPVTTGGIALPSTSVCITPNTYIVAGVSYDCSRQGLYRWFNTAGQFINRICVSTTSPDVAAIISGMSWNHVHGIQTESGTYQNISDAGKYRKWSARCGVIAGLVSWLMPQLGVTARVRNVKTLGTLNGYDEGHLVVETLHGSDYRMWDMTNGVYFKDGTGKHMSTADLIAWFVANPTGMPEMVKLDYDSKYTHDCVTLGNGAILDLGLYWERMFSTPALVEAWYRRIFQSIV
jgi:hypothetical protein